MREKIINVNSLPGKKEGRIQLGEKAMYSQRWSFYIRLNGRSTGVNGEVRTNGEGQKIIGNETGDLELLF